MKHKFFIFLMAVVLLAGVSPTHINAEGDGGNESENGDSSIGEAIVKDPSEENQKSSQGMMIGDQISDDDNTVLQRGKGDITFSQSGLVASNWKYEIKADGTLKVTGYSGSIDSDIDIPSKIDGRTVTEIGDNAFKEQFYTYDITIPDTVTIIGSYAFYRTSVFSTFFNAGGKVTLGKNVKKIGDHAFALSGAINVVLPDSLESIGAYAFDKTPISAVNIPAKLTSIGECAFAECGSITSYTVDSHNPVYCDVSGVLFSKDKKTLLNYPAKKAGSSYTVPQGVITIGSSAFGKSQDLKTVIISNTVTKIDAGAFLGSSITSITIPNTVQTLGEGAFAECTSLASIKIGSGIKALLDYTFQECAIESIEIPENISSINYNAFFKCAKLKMITVKTNNNYYSAHENVLYTKNGETLVYYPTGRNDTSFTIPNYVKSIGTEAFDNAQIKNIVIPENVKEIGYFCFVNSALTSIKIPSTVTKIGNYILQNCESLVSAQYNNETVSIGTFESCGKLTKVILGTAVKTIDIKAFGKCTLLSEINFSTGLQKINDFAFYQDTALPKVITLPSTMTFVSGYAFTESNCSITYPSSLTKQDNGDYKATIAVKIKGTDNYAEAYKVLDIVNQYRTSAGLQALTMDQSLLNTAMQRAAEISVFYSHTRPNDSKCFSADSKMTGENIAVGYGTADAVMTGWKNSKGHWANIMSSRYNSIGIGCYMIPGGEYQWVQCFGDTAATAVARRSDSITVVNSVNVMKEHLKLKFLNSNDLKTMSISDSKYAKVGVINSEWSSSSPILIPECYKLSSSNSNVVRTNGANIVGQSKGTSDITAVLGTVSTTITVTVTDTKETNGQTPGSMYRMYNPNSGEHFYTKDSNEKNSLTSAGWIYEGIGWIAPSSSKTPVYRLYNPNAGDHHYTMNANEKDSLISVGWNYEGIGWYSDDKQTIKLYREYNPNAKAGAHNYTVNQAENDMLVNAGWQFEGVAWYAAGIN